MSQFLTNASTDKTSFECDAPALKMKIGRSSMQGWRSTMEDAELVDTNLPGNKNMACLAIFDGHGGDFVAKQVAEEIVGKLAETKEYNEFNGNNPNVLVTALGKCFLSMDEHLLKTSGADGQSDEVGATGLFVVVTEKFIISANVGDSRCILCQSNNSTPIQMSIDHKPDLTQEKLRIVAAGGTVFRGRVSGGVAVSRSFGDFWFKRNEEGNPEKKPWAHLVIAEPCVNVHARDPNDEFLVLCCDGIYDVMTNEQVQRFVRDQLKAGKSPKEAAELLMDDCLNKGSRDNMSVVIGPSTQKTSHTTFAPKLNLAVGYTSMQGWRDTMEDSDLVEVEIPGGVNGACFAIFDGHGGDHVAKQVAKDIMQCIATTDEYKQFDGSEPRKMVTALSKGFLNMDQALRNNEAIASNADEVGATGLMIIVTEKHIFSANIGDSRCILSKSQNQTPIQMSLDHKPDHETEKLRIVAAGGTVFRGRVCGGVAVSRSFGDFWFKRNEDGKPEKKPWEHLVIAEPCVNVQPRDHVKDEFLVLCCDGIYDVMSNEQVQRFVRDRLKSGKSPKETAELLMDECLNKGSRDNMSVIIVVFNAKK
ncbi:phosphatase 2C [Thraustotheca clavata]|uniref:Phosphatase 2C n=1 Tax=Thraustotheca clavata TaxID=74557 RepID=A0A1V9Z4L8_9STRA|nr:phosphatase 2C [Thraustotheca clavata]